MNPFSLPVRRPIATSMLFIGVFVMGWIAWNRIPVELIPPVSGEQQLVLRAQPSGCAERSWVHRVCGDLPNFGYRLSSCARFKPDLLRGVVEGCLAGKQDPSTVQARPRANPV